MTRLLVITDKLNNARKGDVIDVADSSNVEYLINSGQCLPVDEQPQTVVTKVKDAATKVGRRKRKD
jgi:hypothetical protein